MRAFHLEPAAFPGNLKPVELPSPAVPPGAAKVRVRATSLNFRDLIIARGAVKRSAPLVPLSDGAGEVIEVGAGVDHLKPGDRVAGAFFPYWLDGELSEFQHQHALGGSLPGMLAEEVVLPATAWLKLPEHLSFEEGATLPCAGLTAYHALFEAARLRPGDTVLLEGTGGVSLFALQLAKASGARVIITSQSATKRQRALGVGADHALDYTQDPEWGKSALAWTGGRGVDIAVDVGGPGTFDQAVAALRFGGTLSLLGVLTGTRGEISTYPIFHKALRVAGVYVGSIRMFEHFNRALQATGIHPIIDRRFTFDEAPQAYDHLASAQHFGKIVIEV